VSALTREGSGFSVLRSTNASDVADANRSDNAVIYFLRSF